MTYASKYGGIASGKINAHSNILLPVNLNVVTSKAEITPINNTIKETPTTSNKEFTEYSSNTTLTI